MDFGSFLEWNWKGGYWNIDLNSFMLVVLGQGNYAEKEKFKPYFIWSKKELFKFSILKKNFVSRFWHYKCSLGCIYRHHILAEYWSTNHGRQIKHNLASAARFMIAVG
jgi:hypothetical protein